MSATIARVRALLSVKRLLAVLGAILGGVLYVWFAAVRAVPGVRERKTAARRAWRFRERTRP
jgi:hypothetical protein